MPLFYGMHKTVMLDFTLKVLEQLYKEILDGGYDIIPFLDYLTNCKSHSLVILRHDVDSKIKNAHRIALLESKLGIRSSFYVRYREDLFDRAILKDISQMGHEIGYHYEDLSLARGDFEKAINSFSANLLKFRAIHPVRTICMHGSPLSKWDNRLIWSRYNYRDFGIIGEPYFDIDYSRVYYMTDTGRRWDASISNIRDKVESNYKLSFRTTFDVIYNLHQMKFPQRAMINIHPHSWYDNMILWHKELFWQHAKNLAKYLLIRNKVLTP